MDALEGRLKCTARVSDDKGKGALQDTVDNLDNVYARAMIYHALKLELYSMNQWKGKSARDYYKWLTHIVILLHENHIQGSWIGCLKAVSLQGYGKSTKQW